MQKIIGRLKSKEGNAIEALCVISVVILVSLVFIQLCCFFTSTYTVRHQCNHSIALLEASITEDIYESLTEKNYIYYKDLILDDVDKTKLSKQYENLFFEILGENLDYNEEENKYIGDYYQIDANSIVLTADDVDENSQAIRINMNFNLGYTVYLPIADKTFEITNQEMNVSSDYQFHTDLEDIGDEDVTGGGNDYGDRGM